MTSDTALPVELLPLNPDALMAALEANKAHKADPGRKGCGIEKAIRAYLRNISAVKPLGDWRRGYCDERVAIEQASTGFGSVYQVRVLDGVVWLDFPDQRKAEFSNGVEAAKAAAQADYERRILSALSTTEGE